MVFVSYISIETRRAWEDFINYSLGLMNIDLTGWLPLDQACVLLAVLKEANDDPNLFPHGKWASIQCLEDTINVTLEPFLENAKKQKTT